MTAHRQDLDASDGRLAPGDTPGGEQAVPYLEVHDVGKQFGTFVALRRVNLAVRSGEFVTFLGPSGCGKTTLLRGIAGLDPPSTGRILQAGRDITFLPPAARDFGIVFQSYALFPNLTVTENVAYGLRGPAWPRRRVQERVAELLGLVGLADQAPKYPAQLSGGQQQRVALARALANEPGLLLLDEPLSALDAIVRQHLRQEIRSLQQRLGVTTIMVTHDQEEALGVSDRIVVMSRGRIEQIGTPAEVYDRPASPFVAGFIGHSSRFEAMVDSPAGSILAQGIRLQAEAARHLLYGSRVLVFVRPEHVALHPASAAPPGALPAQVTGLEFLGPVCRVSLQAGPLALMASAAPAELMDLAAEPSAQIAVTLPPERLMVFPEDV
ncbi:ATP-binding cassette domain-containing protein [Roseomonas eburnea]|uniref:ATP-binding cassette domain-containing protein n=1 Tax=Neoroseomonas eburnea TaxID=1346889 RepID=A0A9X9X9J7_9PROT|nr:ATP-binding cassette domain-containing protein [Neoroseomonas eburnea]MBR0680383.1 ATP-binding cassette domain-containing protein [Neoroseomonas eburnea]